MTGALEDAAADIVQLVFRHTDRNSAEEEKEEAVDLHRVIEKLQAESERKTDFPGNFPGDY